MGLRKKIGENITQQTIRAVIKGFNEEKPITKKYACELLNISYNPSRLEKILTEYRERKEYEKLRRKQNKSIPIDKTDKALIITEYLSGESLSNISNSVFRSIPSIKHVLKTYNIPLNVAANEIVILDPDFIKENYNLNDLVYSAKYKNVGYIDNIYFYKIPIYRIWLISNFCRFAVQPYFELSDLTLVQTELGINPQGLSKEEINALIYESFKNANKKLTERE